MRVGFDITQAVKRGRRGIGHYIVSLLRACETTDCGVQPVLFIRDQRWRARRLVEDLVPDAPRRWLLGPFGDPSREIEVFHGMGTRLPWRASVPRTFTCHDLRILDPADDYQPDRPATAGRRMHTTIRRADGILCPTEYGRRRLMHHAPDFDPVRIAVVPHGVDHERFRPRDAHETAAAARRYGLDGEYVVQVGRLLPHKNAECSLRAYAGSRAASEGVDLAFLGGRPEPPYRAHLRTFAAELGIGERVHWVEEIEDDDLPLLYGGARLLLQPSFYEGFGLPVLEAMASGLPGIVADNTCLPEVTGGAWPTVSPREPEQLRLEMDRLLFNTDAHRVAVEAGLGRASEFTWTRTARKTAGFLMEMRDWGRDM
ncbi:MAG: glycosyltransferase family 4 protein [Planctomycetota bacterium]|jgi:alpha-1,3-rhamnosyl/mannosyltransferase